MSDNVYEIEEIVKKHRDELIAYIRFGKDKVSILRVEMMLREVHEFYEKVMRR